MKLHAPAHGRWICLAVLVAASAGASRLEAQTVPVPDRSVRSPLAAAAAAAEAAREAAGAPGAASASVQTVRLASAGHLIPPVPSLPASVVAPRPGQSIEPPEAGTAGPPVAGQPFAPETGPAAPAAAELGPRPPETPPASPLDPGLRPGPANTLPGVAEVAPPAAFPAMHGRPSPLVPLYLSFAALQVADVASTHQALRAGGREANPVVKGFAGNEAAMVAVKAGATAGTILLTERLWKKNRAAAVILMLGLNGAYAAIVANNYRR